MLNQFSSQQSSQWRVSNLATLRMLSLGAIFLFLSACGPRQNAFRSVPVDGLDSLPGRELQAPTPDENLNPDQGSTHKPEVNVTESDWGPFPPDRDEKQLDKVRSRVRPGTLPDAKGRPQRNYEKRLRERFGEKLDKALTTSEISNSTLIKSQKIFREIQRAVDRTHGMDKNLMFMQTSAAIEASEKFEKIGDVSTTGAWTIAVEATSKRHGFANVPCAEFMSEVVRQAYARAGYKIDEDFNRQKGNSLIWTQTASVTGLSKALFKAGWVPYNAFNFRPPTGAIVFHTVGLSPSHTYAAAGLDGLQIVDNGAPKGRDLRKTKAKTRNLMFSTGFFMLPPGITPVPWTSSHIPTS